MEVIVSNGIWMQHLQSILIFEATRGSDDPRRGAITSVLTKQKVSTQSLTEAELVSTDDIISKAIWLKLFLEEQGFKVKENVIYRYNQSTMKLETNDKASSGNYTRHFNIKYFHITDLIH